MGNPLSPRKKSLAVAWIPEKVSSSARNSIGLDRGGGEKEVNGH